MVFIERADRGPQVVFIEMADRAPISPTFRELLRLVPQEFGGQQLLPSTRCGAGPTLRTRQGPAVPPEPPHPTSSVSTRLGERGSLGGHRPHTSRKVVRPQGLLLPLPSSLLQQTLPHNSFDLLLINI